MKPYHKNPRQITRKQMDNLRDWLAELGDLSGIVHDLNTDEIIGGNQRGMVFDVNKCEVELIDGPHEPDEQGTVAHGFIVWKGARYAYRQVRWDDKQAEKANIVANKAGGGWDFDTLANEFEVSDLIEWGFDAAELGIDLTGGTDDDAEPQIDRAEELREQWGVESGQLWRLPSRTPGQEHRLICGDCTDAAVVERVMGGERAAMSFTSPPYNIGQSISEKSHGANKRKYIYNKDEMASSDYLTLLNKSLINTLLFSDYAFFNIQSLASNKVSIIEWLYHNREQYADRMIWDKTTSEPAYPQNVLSTRFEDVYIFSKKATRAIGTKSFRGTVENLISVNSRQDKGNSDIHKAVFPVELYTHFVSNFCNHGEAVLEPFCGTGTSLVSCENTDRQCRAVEISPAYVAVALQRYVDAFGIEPELVTG